MRFLLFPIPDQSFFCLLSSKQSTPVVVVSIDFLSKAWCTNQTVAESEPSRQVLASESQRREEHDGELEVVLFSSGRNGAGGDLELLEGSEETAVDQDLELLVAVRRFDLDDRDVVVDGSFSAFLLIPFEEQLQVGCHWVCRGVPSVLSGGDIGQHDRMIRLGF